jgi:hypothetical protein
MRQYSIDEVEVAWNGQDWKEGMAAGTTLTVSRTSPDKSLKVQANGQAIISKNPDHTGTITVLVNQVSQLYQDLMAIANADRRVGQKVTARNFRISMLGTGSVYNYTNAVILETPGNTFATEESDLSFVFAFERENVEPNDNVDNIVGG